MKFNSMAVTIGGEKNHCIHGEIFFESLPGSFLSQPLKL